MVLTICTYEIHELTRHGLRHLPLSTIIEGFFARFAGFFLVWLFTCLASTAVAAVVQQLSRGKIQLAWDSEVYAASRNRFRPILSTVSLTFVCGLAYLAIAMFIAGVLFVRFAKHPSETAITTSSYIVVGVALSLIAWIGLTFPVVMGENASAVAAVKRSYFLSKGCKLFSAFLVIQSVVVSVVAGYGVYLCSRWMAFRTAASPDWAGWLGFFLGIFVGAAAETPLFIGFALLYVRQTGATGSCQQRSV